VEIILCQDSDGFALREPIGFTPNCEFADGGVDLALSYIGGKRFSCFDFRSLSQLLKAFAFLLRIWRGVIHSLF